MLRVCFDGKGIYRSGIKSITTTTTTTTTTTIILLPLLLQDGRQRLWDTLGLSTSGMNCPISHCNYNNNHESKQCLWDMEITLTCLIFHLVQSRYLIIFISNNTRFLRDGCHANPARCPTKFVAHLYY